MSTVPQVQVIPPIGEQAKKLRVAAYARVSSDSEEQLNSFATQVAYYTAGFFRAQKPRSGALTRCGAAGFQSIT